MRGTMRIASGLLAIVFITHPVLCAQFGSGHKSEAEIARMTPDQRVEEYCREHARHLYLSHREYAALLTKYLLKDGLKVVPQVIRELDAYDPTKPVSASEERFRRYEGADFILGELEANAFRVRAFEEGRKAIDAVRRSIERMRAAHFDNPKEVEYEMHLHYEMSVNYLKSLEGLSLSDSRIQETLKYKYNVILSKDELLDFINYLVLQDPYYPVWSERESFREKQPNGENGKWIRLYKNPEPFYQAYLEYKAKKSKSDQLR